MYDLQYKPPLSKLPEIAWYHVSDITSVTLSKQRKKEKVASRTCTRLKSKYYIPMTRKDKINKLATEFSVDVAFDPDYDDHSQFTAIVNQLQNIGMYRSDETLRTDVVRHLQQQLDKGIDSMHHYLVQEWKEYMHKLKMNDGHADDRTLQAICDIFHVQIVILSTSQCVVFCPDGKDEMTNDVPIFTLGHFRDGCSNHYLSVTAKYDALKSVDSQKVMITDYQHMFSGSEGHLCDDIISLVDLPLDIITLIVAFCIATDKASKQNIAKVHSKLATAVASVICNNPLTNQGKKTVQQSDFGLKIALNPKGDGNCQFAAISNQLSFIGISKCEKTLRDETVSYLSNHEVLGCNNLDKTKWHQSVLETPEIYLERMATEYEFGDQLTLQAMSEMLNVQIIIISTLKNGCTLVSPDGRNIVTGEWPILTLGHYSEDQGQHYVSLEKNLEAVELIVEQSPQIEWALCIEGTQTRTDNENVEEYDHNENDHEHEAEVTQEKGDIQESHRRPQEIDQPKHLLELPLEILTKIVFYALSCDITCQDHLKGLHPTLATAVHYAMSDVLLPSVYMSDELLQRLNLLGGFPISVNKILRVAGKNSGLSQSIRKTLSAGGRKWHNAWIIFRKDTHRPNWFEMLNIFWKRSV